MKRVKYITNSFYKFYNPEHKAQIREDLSLRCISSKTSEAAIDAFVDSVNTLTTRDHTV